MAITASSLSRIAASPIFGQDERGASALRRPAEALAREAEGTRVRLSEFGRAKSAAAELQSAGRRLQQAPAATADDARRYAENFVAAFNAERSALARVATPGDGVTAEAARAQIAGGQLARVVADNATAFRESGIRIADDGTLAVDAKAVEAAFNANPTALSRSLGEVGRATEATTTRQLSQAGSVGAAVEQLSNRLQRIEDRQSELAAARSRVEESRLSLEASSRRYGFGAVGAGAYLGIFGL